MSNIHPTAIIEEGAVIPASSIVGPYCIVGKDVKLGEDCHLHSHVVIRGNTTIGDKCEVYPFASLGGNPPDLKFKGEETYLEIGNNNSIREYVTINLGTGAGGGLTKVGNNNLIMPLCHIAHDCFVGNNIVMSHSAMLAGHVIIDDNAILGGMSGIHQFTRIGKNAMIGGGSLVIQDVIPYGLVSGNRAHLENLNLIGLQRKGFSKSEIKDLRLAYSQIFTPDERTFNDRLEEVAKEYDDNPHVLEIVNFIKYSKKGVCKPNAD
ncbi:MAG: Acyl-[acyl-carrier-protein]--UDP-N-acetylglucosamine O-acyltransferase [Proteobacteria bacterium]|jgi:UDP-N-acetylglucosamine acyltransferase|nr:MAG: Acyl-[acyl-carrier-protein]--UDP-N-acetylglucosamine O-acyltransferase [Pseudomonadota bacterium]